MKKNYDIKYFDRMKNKEMVEKVYGGDFVELMYKTKLKYPLGLFAKNALVSRIYGISQSTKSSAKKVPAFIQKFNIPIHEYQKGTHQNNKIENSYLNFNEFFTRKFKEGERSFIQEENILPAPCEARYFAHSEITSETKIPVKGKHLLAKDLIKNEDFNDIFDGGPFVVARLCPVDYHRYHYFDEGTTLSSYTIAGAFDSVNPIALRERPEIFINNERRVSILETKNFGKVAYIEVGAMMVGKIVQSHDEMQDFKRGDEKGYFLFGASTVILLGEKGKWTPSMDILTNTQKGIETYIKLGHEIAKI